jgi:hypothetical protein
MRRSALMENITMTKTTQITLVRFASLQAADRSLTVGVRGSFYAPTRKASAVTDVAYLGSWRPPV